jgi:hypothetical protein
MNSRSRLSRAVVIALATTACFAAGLLTRAAATHLASLPPAPTMPSLVGVEVAGPIIALPLWQWFTLP